MKNENNLVVNKNININNLSSFNEPKVSMLDDFIILDDIPIDFIHNLRIEIKIIKRKIDNQFYRMTIYPLNEYYGTELRNKKFNFLIPRIKYILECSKLSKHILQYRDSFIERNTNSLLFITEFAYDTIESIYINRYRKMNCIIPENKLIDIIFQVSSGLFQLHNKNIYNINLSAKNIFVVGNDIKINPFCPIFNVDNNSSEIVCPEIANQKPYEKNSDIWYFGLLIYELCCKKPMKRIGIEDLNLMYSNIIKGKFEPIPKEYSKEINNLIRECLQYSPYRRISSENIMKQIIKIKATKKINEKIKNYKLQKEKNDGVSYIDNCQEFNKVLLTMQNYKKIKNDSKNKKINKSFILKNKNIDFNKVNNNKKLIPPNLVGQRNKSFNNINSRKPNCIRCYKKRLSENLIIDKNESFNLLYKDKIRNRTPINKHRIHQNILDLNSMMKFSNIQANNLINQFNHNEIRCKNANNIINKKNL